MHSHYDAFEFTEFMDAFMKSHPEVAVDQKYGWDIYWNPRHFDQEKQHVQITKIQQGNEKAAFAHSEGEEGGKAA